MKLAPREVARWLAKPPQAPVILVHGEDRGSVTDLATRLAQAFVPDLQDPFLVALLDADDLKGEPARLHDELFALAPGGARKLVRLREATDRHTSLIETVLAEPPAGNVLLIEAGGLAFRSSLRRLFEGHRAAVAVNCDGASSADTDGFIREALRQDGLEIESDASAALATRLGADRAVLRRALEVLALYKRGEDLRRVTLADVHAATGDAETLGFDAVIDALMSGARSSIDRALAKALEAGTSPIGILRAALRAFQRIHLASQLIERGMAPDQAIAGLIPPLPYAARGAFIAACRRWGGKRAGQALTLIDEAEAQCKTTGLPEDVICAELLLRLSDLTEKRPAA